ncbi:hypothetical protein Y032_0074g834 [Ancylostoma ceylanicum]|uniref:Uncharacterized protein n=1 Tax=Ancylostoma ceylanicum TaxID=53326 RepID=A0A016TWF1_9BILA|nr:hypothetical protein Y032_0074g834 [Ancylostoma ceylanicum]
MSLAVRVLYFLMLVNIALCHYYWFDMPGTQKKRGYRWPMLPGAHIGIGALAGQRFYLRLPLVNHYDWN